MCVTAEGERHGECVNGIMAETARKASPVLGLIGEILLPSKERLPYLGGGKMQTGG
jgi:hypothetical protein